jgi:DNA-directed RNA polymerase subunit RPC12/RpoP
MAIRVICGSCGSKIDAKDELRGQTRRCPKCRQPILIEPAAQPQASKPQPVKTAQPASQPAADAATPATEGLKMRRLRPDDLYFVVGSDKIVAYWKAGEGWMLNVGNGFSQVKRSPGLIPDLGEFVLAEGRVAQTDNGRRLRGLRFWSLTGRGVLLALGRAETEILEKAQFPTVPSGAQKRFILDQIRKLYFRDFTDDALEIVEYLTSFDSHSQSVGTFDD